MSYFRFVYTDRTFYRPVLNASPPVRLFKVMMDCIKEKVYSLKHDKDCM